jgi:hypothetical protein
MDAVGSTQAALFGMSDGGVIAAKFAALDPRVDGSPAAALRLTRGDGRLDPDEHDL